MNLRNVLRAYSHLRQLTDDEAALLATLRAMNDSERELLVESLGPVKATGKKGVKKPATTREYDHCLRCGTTKRDSSHKNQASPDYHEFQSSQGKSARAAKLAEQIKGATNKSRTAAMGIACTYTGLNGDESSVCGELEDNPIHDSTMGYRDYHPFKSASSTARGATNQSSTSDAEPSTTASFKVETAGAQSAAGGSSE